MRGGIAKVSGWTEDSQISAIESGAQAGTAKGTRSSSTTDIARDGVLVGPNMDSLSDMIDGTGLDVIASGGVSNLDDVRRIAAVQRPGNRRPNGVIIGKALYEQLLTLEEALEVSGC
jgi:phosphoribosylformimino-5-aminoimidazole carboxamide ribotide isomerase